MEPDAAKLERINTHHSPVGKFVFFADFKADIKYADHVSLVANNNFPAFQIIRLLRSRNTM